MSRARIDRREFVRRSSAAAGLALVPDWVARGFALHQDPVAKEPSRRDQLRTARDRAVAQGKPLLVLVVPADRDERYLRGRQLGALLNHGSHDVLSDLAMCQPACATVALVRAELGAEGIDGEPMLLVAEPPRAVDGPRVSWHVQAIAPELKIPPAFELGRDVDKIYRDNNTVLAAALHDAVARDRAMLAERADRERATLTEDEHRVLTRWFTTTDEPPPDELLVRAAAVVLMAAEAPRRRGDRARLLKHLIEASRRAFIEQRLPGSRWAHSSGCGTVVEGQGALGVMGPCGTGLVPPVCQRFLYLLTE